MCIPFSHIRNYTYNTSAYYMIPAADSSHHHLVGQVDLRAVSLLLRSRANVHAVGGGGGRSNPLRSGEVSGILSKKMTIIDQK